MREEATASHLPIIALTASALEEDKRQCREAGMDAFLMKPIRPKDLFEALTRQNIQAA
jgi:two-component system sensor histidine kinase RpfC